MIDNLEVEHQDILLTNYEDIATRAEFKVALNSYLKQLVKSPVRSLKDVIAFNNKNPELVSISALHQLINPLLYACFRSKNGYEKLIKKNKLDALMAPFIKRYIAPGGYPGINVPAGYDFDGKPFGIEFAGLKGSEPTLIEIAYSFEQATKVRRPPF